jgi:hypothetical protein
MKKSGGCLRNWVQVYFMLGLAGGLLLAAGGRSRAAPDSVPGAAEKKPRTAFAWKALWVQAEPLKDKGQMELMARRAKQMGFNVIIAAPSADLVAAVHGQGLQLYAWVSALKGLAPPEFYAAQPAYLQAVKPAEEALVGKPRENPDRENVLAGPWLCPDHGLLPIERQALERLLRQYPLEGLALDNVGYRNYSACYCNYSETRRANYARLHPTMLRSQIWLDFSEQALVEYVRQVAAAAEAVNPRLKLAIHINPDFDLNPRFGNKLPVDYCGETIAWRCRPFWSFGKIMKRTQLFLEAEGEYEGQNVFVPFIGVAGEYIKGYAGRLRTEINIARSTGTGVIMLGYYADLAAHPDLADVVAQELR